MRRQQKLDRVGGGEASGQRSPRAGAERVGVEVAAFFGTFLGLEDVGGAVRANAVAVVSAVRALTSRGIRAARPRSLTSGFGLFLVSALVVGCSTKGCGDTQFAKPTANSSRAKDARNTRSARNPNQPPGLWMRFLGSMTHQNRLKASTRPPRSWRRQASLEGQDESSAEAIAPAGGLGVCSRQLRKDRGEIEPSR